MVLSLGFLLIWFSLILFSNFAPQFMQVSLNPNDIVPQLLHALIFDLYVLIPININNNNKRGIRNKSKIIFPRKLKKKFIPKIGIITVSYTHLTLPTIRTV